MRTPLRLLMLLALVFLVTLPAGLAEAQDATPEGTGTAVIWDNQALSDAITYTMAGVTAPAADTVYEGWLVSDDGSVKLSTGVMTVGSDGSVVHTYVSPDGENLIHSYNKVLVTVEPVPDADPGPSGVFAFSHEVPIDGMAHIRHLLTNWPPGTSKGILTNLKEQLDVAVLHSSLAVNSDTLAGVRQHIEHVVNAIEGPGGPNYGDLDGNGSVEDFGDGVGVLTHAQDRKHGPFAAGAAASDTVIVAGSKLVDATGKNAEDWAALARDQALDAMATDNITLAKLLLGPGANTTVSLLEAARDGFDSDVDGTIESIAGEGGADQAYVEAQRMATYTLEPGGLEPSAPTGPGLPGVGDFAPTPLTGAVAGIVGLTLVLSGAYLIRRRVKA